MGKKIAGVIATILAVWGSLASIFQDLFAVPPERRRLVFELLWGPKTVWVLLPFLVATLLYYLWSITRRLDSLEAAEKNRNKEFQAWLQNQGRISAEQMEARFRNFNKELGDRVMTHGQVLDRYHAETERRLTEVEDLLRSRTSRELGLNLLYHPGKYPDCIGELPDGRRIFRFALVNTGERSIDGVKAYLQSVSPNDLGFGNIEFVFQHDREPWPRSLNGDTIHPSPGTSSFVDVAILFHHVEDAAATAKRTGDSPPRRVRMRIIRDDIQQVLPQPVTSYRFTIRIVAPNMASIVRTFTIDPTSGISFA